MSSASNYTSPCRRETSREATIRAAMAIPGRFRPDGCWTELVTNDAGATDAKAKTFVQRNRKYRRSNKRGAQ